MNQSVCSNPNAIHSVINQLNGWRYVVLFDTVVWFEDYPEVVKSCRTTETGQTLIKDTLCNK